MKKVKPILFGLLCGVYENQLRWVADDCYLPNYKLLTIHTSKKNAQLSITEEK